MASRTTYVGTESVGDPLTKSNFDKGPGGETAYVVTTSNGSTVSTVETDFQTLTFTAGTSRRYRLSFTGNFATNTDGGAVWVSITDNSNNHLAEGYVQMANHLLVQTVTVYAEVAPSSGSVTYKTRYRNQTGAPTVTAQCSSTSPAYFSIDDIGPAF